MVPPAISRCYGQFKVLCNKANARRGLFEVQRDWGELKRSARGTLVKGKRRRKTSANVRFSGRICGSLVMTETGNDLDYFDCSFKFLNIEG